MAMSSCRYCGCSGWLVTLLPSNLCGNCEHLVSSELEQRARVLAESERGFEDTRNAATKLDRLDLAVSQLEALAAYERRGIQTPVESAERRLRESRRELDALVMRTAKQDLDSTMTTVRAEGEPEGKARALAAFLLRLKEYAGRASSKGPLPVLEKKVRAAVWRVRLNASLERARLAERGDAQGAARAYREALTLLGAPEASGPLVVSQRLRVQERLEMLDSGRPA